MAYPGAQRSSKNKIKGNIFVFVSSLMTAVKPTIKGLTYKQNNQLMGQQQNNKKTGQRKCQCKQVCHAKPQKVTQLTAFSGRAFVTRASPALTDGVATNF